MNDKMHLIGNIADSARYAGLHPLFGKAFAFLGRPDIADLPPGRYDIEENLCWANVQEVELVPLAERKLEAHRRFIDIQAPLTGPETIGLAELDDAARALPFNEENDYVLYEGKSTPATIRPGEFAIFFPPSGAHAPCCLAPDGPKRIKKVVVKVAADADATCGRG